MSVLLAAIDASPCAQAVLAAARPLADLFGADPVALHVREGAEERAQQLADAAGVKLRLASGSPVETIIREGAREEVVALALGARGVSGGPLPAGRTALSVIAAVDKPLAVIPPGWRPIARIACVLVPLEGTLAGSQAAGAIVELARHHGACVEVLHVHGREQAPPFVDQAHHAHSAWEQEFLARFLDLPGSAAAVRRRVGEVGESISAVAGEVGADLVVLAWSQVLAGGHAPVVREVLAASAVPVLLVPVAPRRAPEPL
ncbi:MAG TPA: universal stress protein [Solirubrobacteraceae bacterium]|nr:universal stress protein [Solirubrobacteraceae bacterium]